jgi:hypothetical protein
MWGLAVLAALCLSLGSGVGHALGHSSTQLLDAHAGAASASGHVALAALGASMDGRWWAGLWLVAGIGLLRLVAGRSRGRAIALGLSLALGVFSLESAVHSIHHLASPETAATCPVFSGSEHLGWGEIPVVASDVPPPHVAPAPAVVPEPLESAPVPRPGQGRAPPA